MAACLLYNKTLKVVICFSHLLCASVCLTIATVLSGRLTLTETPLLLLVIVIGCGAPQPSIPPSVSGTVEVLHPLEEEWEDAPLSMGCTSIHHRNCIEKKNIIIKDKTKNKK